MKNYKIAVAGTGYVGLSLGVLLSQHHQVVAVDIVQAQVDMMNELNLPTPGLYSYSLICSTRMASACFSKSSMSMQRTVTDCFSCIP